MRRVFRLPFGKAHIAREVDDELSFHLEQRTARLIAAGWSIDAARAEAMRQFGDVESVRQSCVTMDEQRERAMNRANLIGEVRQDVAYALRTLRRNLGFTTVVVVALATAIGANTAIFTLVNAVLVRSLPVRHPEQLVAVGNTSRVSSFSQGAPRTDLLSYPMYRDLAKQNSLFSGVLASGRTGHLDAHVEPGAGAFEHPRGRFVSGNYFDLLGVRAAAGRTFDASADLVAGAAPVATISYGYWTQRFHNDTSVIGRAIVINGIKITIVGVTAPGFAGEIVGQPNSIWLPISMHDALEPNQRILDDRNSDWLLLLGRLKPSATLAQAERQIPELIKRDVQATSGPKDAAAFLGQAPTYYVSAGSRGFSRVRSTFAAPLVTLMMGVALLLVIVCANVANLLLARAVTRGREMAVRLALGAGRGRLVRQLLTESAVLAGLGAAAGLSIAWWGSRALLVAASGGPPTALDLGLDRAVLGFTLSVAMLAVALFGVVPALFASRVDLASTMRAGASAVTGSALGARGRRAPLGRLLIAGQVALSVVLLVGAGMLVRSLRNVQSTDVGLDRDHLVVVDLDITTRGYSRARLAEVVHALHDRFAAIPGVAAVSYSENGIFSGSDSDWDIEVPGFEARAPGDTTVAYDQAGPGYVHAIGGRLVAGRDLAPSDEGRPPREVLINATMAQFYFPNENAIGRYIHMQDSIALQIVGVVADTHDHQPLTDAPKRRMYYPYVHTDTQPGQLAQPGSLRFEVRASGDPVGLVQPIRKAVTAVDAQLPIDGIDPLAVLMSDSIAGERLVAQLATAFGLLALALAAIGLYGVMSYAVSRRTGEMGLRVALGAQQRDVVGLILFDSLRLVLVGLVVGLPLAVASARLLRSQLHGVNVADPASIIAAVVVLAASASAAALIPALRASKVSPIVALRAD